MEPSVKIFSGNATPELAKKITELYGMPLGQVAIQKFSDGEFQPVFQESIRGDIDVHELALATDLESLDAAHR